MNMFTVLVIGFGVIFVVALIASLPVYWLWNGLMPDIFGLKEITWLQALGLSLLTSMLFKPSSTSSSK